MSYRLNYNRQPLQLSIPHADVIGLTSWLEPAAEWRGTEFVVPKRKRGFVLHYPGVSQFAGIRSPLSVFQRIQREYLSSRKYSNGYNFGVFAGGEIVVNRGFYKSAANGSSVDNDEWCAIFLGIDDDDLITPKMILAVQRLIHYGRTQHGYGDGVIGHQDLKATGCPGPAQALVRSGAFLPDLSSWPEQQAPPPPPRPTPPPPPLVLNGDNTMFFLRLPIFGSFIGLRCFYLPHSGSWLYAHEPDGARMDFEIAQKLTPVIDLQNVSAEERLAVVRMYVRGLGIVPANDTHRDVVAQYVAEPEVRALLGV